MLFYYNYGGILGRMLTTCKGLKHKNVEVNVVRVWGGTSSPLLRPCLPTLLFSYLPALIPCRFLGVFTMVWSDQSVHMKFLESKDIHVFSRYIKLFFSTNFVV